MRISTFARIVRISAIVIVAVVAAFVIRGIPDAVAIVRGFTAARSDIARVREAWNATGAQDTRAVVTHLDRAQANLARSREVAMSSFFLRAVPGMAFALSPATALAEGGLAWVDGARALASVATDARAIADRYGDRSFESLAPSERGLLLAFVGDALTRSRIALEDFARGDAALRTVPCPPRFVRSLVGFRACARGYWDVAALVPSDDLTELRATLRVAVAAGNALFAFAGSTQPHDALLLFLNNTELRPSGGFLGTYGLVTVQRGAITAFRTDDVYNLDREVEGTLRIAPPEPFRRHRIVPYWYLRDANWSPDFAESSRTVLDFYRREHGSGSPEIVVGFTTALAESLMRVVGPVTINGVRYDATNIVDELEYQVEKGYYVQGIPRPQRKAIIEPLSREVIARVERMPIHSWGVLVDAVRAAVRERHLMAYAPNPELTEAIARFGLSGRVAAVLEGNDALLVVDANLGALKTDPVVQRSIRYAIIPDGETGYRGLIQLSYRNTGTFTWKTSRYRTYTRVYLPIGTELIAARGAMADDRSDAPGPVDVTTELGRTVFGAFVSIEPGQERTLAFEFRLAPSVVQAIRAGVYRLAATKQAGTIATPLTIDHEFGTLVQSADPPEPPAAWGDRAYRQETHLREDRTFVVNF